MDARRGERPGLLLGDVYEHGVGWWVLQASGTWSSHNPLPVNSGWRNPEVPMRGWKVASYCMPEGLRATPKVHPSACANTCHRYRNESRTVLPVDVTVYMRVRERVSFLPCFQRNDTPTPNVCPAAH